jgi:hypothetical protein
MHTCSSTILAVCEHLRNLLLPLLLLLVRAAAKLLNCTARELLLQAQYYGIYAH